jgi:hypothetical protein
VTEAAVIAGMVAAFAVLLALKRLSGLRFCVLCVTVGATWLALLALHWAGTYENRVLLALLMGQTITGLHYLVEGRVREELLVFRLPFVLTLVALFYLAIAPDAAVAAGLSGVVAATWVIALAVYATRNVDGLKSIARQVIECCKDW